MSLHKEGHIFLCILFFILVIINLALYFLIPDLPLLLWISVPLFLLVFIYFCSFFRNPNRKYIINKKTILAPADGKIVAIETVDEKEYFHEKRIQISVFMSIYDVHINWYPVSGTVKYLKYHKGSNIIARYPKSSTNNERMTIVIEKEDKTGILIRQIAGAVARRIVTYAKTGDKVTQGNELGFIKFGSRVDLLLPPDTKILVSIGQKVRGTQTLIAEI